MPRQDPIAIFGSNMLGADRIRQREAPHERAIGAFDSEAVFFFDVLVEFPLPTNGQRIVDNADPDVLVSQIRPRGGN